MDQENTPALVDMATLRVLVVDDEPFVLKLAVRVLKGLGVKFIYTADTGAAALLTLQSHNFVRTNKNIDLIICDLEMPNMDGFEFVGNLRKGPKNLLPQTPVIILSGHSEQHSIELSVRLGISGYVLKPVAPDMLEKQIVNAMTCPAINPKVLDAKT